MVEDAALGDFNRVFERCRNIGEEFAHFRLGLHVLLGRIALDAARVLQRKTFRDGAAHFMRFKVFLVEKLNRMRCNNGKPMPDSKIRRVRSGKLIIAAPRTLKLDVESVAKLRL